MEKMRFSSIIRIITEGRSSAMRMYNPAHPGKILAYYLEGRSVTEVARHLGVTRPALSRVLNGKAGVSADMALRLSIRNRIFGSVFRLSAIFGLPPKRNAPK
jgi:addiction module HigA family antidote